MSTRRDCSHVKPQLTLLVGIILVASFFMIRGARLVLSKATPSAQENLSRPQTKKLVNLIRHHLPLKVKVKNFHNEKWMRDLEVEVTNTSDKPIYFLEFFVVMRDVKSFNGNPVGFPLRYGRMALIDYITPLQSDDVGIQPGISTLAPNALIPTTLLLFSNWQRNKEFVFPECALPSRPLPEHRRVC